MEANHDGLYNDSQLEQHFPFEESTVFGDMFMSTNPLKPGLAPFEVYVCHEDDLTTQCNGEDNSSSWASLRICDGVAPGGCGMTFLGKCSSVCTNDNGYWVCPDANGDTWSETIRMQLIEWAGICD